MSSGKYIPFSKNCSCDNWCGSLWKKEASFYVISILRYLEIVKEICTWGSTLASSTAETVWLNIWFHHITKVGGDNKGDYA